MVEEWKPVSGYEGYYLVSNIGNIFSIRSKKVLKVRNSCGYQRVNLSVDGFPKSFAVHRLVAEAFIPNPENKPTVNHINEIKIDNRVGNLEWATNKEQNNHGTRTQRAKEHTDYIGRKIDYSVVASKHDYKRMGKLFSIPVYQFDNKGTFQKAYSSLREASECTGICISHISSCINGKRKSAGGCIWKKEP